MAAPRLFVIMMENLGCSQVVTNAYVQSLIASGAAALGYSGVTNPSLPNYLALGSGAWDYDTAGDNPSGPFAEDNLFAQLTAAGVSWGAYIDGYPGTLPLPASGSTIDYATLTDNLYGFAGHHFGGFFWDSFVNVPGQMALLQGWSALQTLLSGPASGVPQLSWITPTLSNQKTAGGMQTYVEAIQASAAWAEGAVIYVTWDNQPIADAPAYLPVFVQAPDTDDTGGNVLAVVLASTARPQPRIIPGTQWNRTLSHYSLLAAIQTAYGLPLLGYASSAPAWPELVNLLRGYRGPGGAGAPSRQTLLNVSVPPSLLPAPGTQGWTDGRVDAVVTEATGEVQLFVRTQPSPSMGLYYLNTYGSNLRIKVAYANGSDAVLAGPVAIDATPPYRLSFQVRGQALTGWWGNATASQQLQATDATWASGGVGGGILSGSGLFSSFRLTQL